MRVKNGIYYLHTLLDRSDKSHMHYYRLWHIIPLYAHGEGAEKSDGEYNVPLIHRLTDGFASFEFMRQMTHAHKLHIMAGSMNGEIGAFMAKELGDVVSSLSLIAAAAYRAGAEKLSLGTPEFTAFIPDPQQDLHDSPAFTAANCFRGPVFVAYGEQDGIIPTIVKNQYSKRAEQYGTAISVRGVGHVLLSDTQNPAIQEMYHQQAQFMKGASYIH